MVGPVASSAFRPWRGVCCLFSGSGLISSSCPSSYFLTEEGQEVAKDHPQHTEGRSRAGRQPAWNRFPARPGPPVPSDPCGTGCCSLGAGTRLRPPFPVRAPWENCAHAPRVVATPEPRSSESLVPEALGGVFYPQAGCLPCRGRAPAFA